MYHKRVSSIHGFIVRTTKSEKYIHQTFYFDGGTCNITFIAKKMIALNDININ